MQIVFHFPPDNLFTSLLIWIASLVFVKWIIDLYKNRHIGVTVAKIKSLKKLPFFIVPGKVDKEYIENKLNRKVMGVSYIHGSRLNGWIVVFFIAWLFMFLMGFVEIIDNRVL